ncbi:MAG: hypothetical protein ABIE94_07345 [archaeon]
MNSFIKRSYFKDVIIVVLYVFFIFFNIVVWGVEYGETALAIFQRILVVVGLILLIWYHVVYVKANKKKK